MRHIFRHAWMITALALAGGCASVNVSSPFNSSAPTRADIRLAEQSEPPKRSVIVVGPFEDPSPNRFGWSDIGSGLQGQLSRALGSDARFVHRRHDTLGQAVARAVAAPDRDTRLRELGRHHAEVDFVILGRVTDFHHTADVPGTSRRGALGIGTLNDAVVGLELTIVDLRTGRVATRDIVRGTVSAGKASTDERYTNIHGLDSYGFRNTPLGEASTEAVGRAMERVRAIAPTQVAEARIIRVEGWRELIIAGGRDHGIEVGQRYYLCTRPTPGGSLVAVKDDVAGTPLMAQIMRVERSAAVAWVMGEAPSRINLSSAILTREAPRSATATANVQP